jgi:hypothetical protein
MLWADEGTVDASANTPIAPIQIHARIIVSPHLGCLPSPSGFCADGKWPNSLSPKAIGVATSTITISSPLPEQELGA